MLVGCVCFEGGVVCQRGEGSVVGGWSRSMRLSPHHSRVVVVDCATSFTVFLDEAFVLACAGDVQ